MPQVKTIKDLDKKIDELRRRGKTDTDILGALSSGDSAFGSSVQKAREIGKNDRDILNLTSQKLAGKMPTVKSVPIKEEQTISSEPKEKKGTLKNLAIGFGKGLMSTVKGTSSLGEKMISGSIRAVLPQKAEKFLGIRQKDELTSAEKLITEKMTKPVGTAQKVGYGIEQIAEFFIPASKVSKIGKLESVAKLTSKLPNFLQKYTPKTISLLAEGASNVGVSSLQSGEIGKEQLKVGALTPVIGGAMGVVGKGAGKLGDYVFSKTVPSTITQKGKDVVRGLDIGKAVSQTGIATTRKGLMDNINKKISGLGTRLGDVIKKEGADKVYDIDDLTKGLKNSILKDSNTFKKLKATPVDIKKVEDTIEEVITDYRTLYKGKKINAEELQDLKLALSDGLESEFNKSVGATMRAKPLTEIQLRSRIQKTLEEISPEISELNKKLAPLLEAKGRLMKKGSYSGYLTDLIAGGLYAGRPIDVLTNPAGYIKDFLYGILLKRGLTSTAAKTSSGTLLKQIDKIIDTPLFRSSIMSITDDIIQGRKE